MSVKTFFRNLSPGRALRIRKDRKRQQATVDRAIEIISQAVPAATSQGLFVDCGFNTRGVFDRYYAKLAPRFQFVGFEIQSILYQQALRDLANYRSGRPEFLHAAVSDHDGELFYYEPEKWSLNYKGGASIVEEKRDRPATRVNSAVACVDFARFLREKTQDRPFTVVKMDIEGAEYCVMERVAAEGLLDRIDLLFIEFHSQYLDSSGGVDWGSRHQALVHALDKSGVRYFDWI